MIARTQLTNSFSNFIAHSKTLLLSYHVRQLYFCCNTNKRNVVNFSSTGFNNGKCYTLVYIYKRAQGPY